MVSRQDLLDSWAMKKKPTPAQAGTTWTDDLLITAFPFGHFLPARSEVYELQNWQIRKQKIDDSR
jgi:hypothetical protein